LAWCYNHVGKSDKAIDTMRADAADSQSLQDEALRDLVGFFAVEDKTEEAFTYFNRLGDKDLSRRMLKRLASVYFEQGKTELCVQTYRRLIAEDTTSSKAPDYQNEIILAYQKIGQKRETQTEIVLLLETYGKNSDSGWVRANSADQGAVKEAQTYIEKNLRTLALSYHNDAKKLGTGRDAKESYKLAGWGYSTYLKEFPDNKHSYEMRYAYGELLYKLKMYDKAYDQYMAVVKVDPNGKHSKFCAESAVFAADEMIKREEKSSQGAAPPGSKTEETPLTEWENNLLLACDQFSKTYPSDKQARSFTYKSAYLLYKHNMFKRARERFRAFIGMDPKSREAEQAANLVLDSFALEEDWANLKEVSKAFYDQEGLGSPTFKKEVYNIYAATSFKLIEQIATTESSAPVDKAALYLAFADEHSDSIYVGRALAAAVQAYEDVGSSNDARNVRRRLAGLDDSTEARLALATLCFTSSGTGPAEKRESSCRELAAAASTVGDRLAEQRAAVSGAIGDGSGDGQFGSKGEGGIGRIGGDPIILGALDKSLIDAVIKRHRNQIRYCYRRQLTRNPNLAGKITFEFVIAKDGTVSKASIKDSSMGDGTVEQCITERVLRMKFPAPKGGGVINVTYPFQFPESPLAPGAPVKLHAGLILDMLVPNTMPAWRDRIESTEE
jgi:TolA-binding protein